ncbi:hypothetical protein GA0070616_1933 [Micromonospora nigra]|uniref:Lipoprotein n=1 Tax=Micromonospora nigra TaxID=145857 RepID=A0A1C6RT46_9ACTN|nr:hypothetical protein [Micromonospora nigra]SCL20246.1 hypothetical protein GA0070616_1933 [Micromonospora nigra]
MTLRTGTTRRVGTAAVAVLAVVLAGGCTGSDDSGGAAPTPSPSPDPKADLLAAVPDEEDPAFRFTSADNTGDVSGVVDPLNRGLDIDTVVKEKDFTLTMSFRVLESRTWMKVDFKGAEELHDLMKLPKEWMELDLAKLDDPAGAPTYDGTDPGNTRTIIRAASDIQEQEGTYTGVVDLTADPAVAEVLEDVDVVELADAARQVPLTAQVDAEGNLTSLVLEIPAAGKRKATEYAVRYFDYGTTPPVTAFTDTDATKAPASAYELLND